MAITTEQQESHFRIRLEGECAVASAADLKSALLKGLAAGKDLHLDLERVAEIDTAVLQLLWAVGWEAERSAVKVELLLSEAAGALAREVGFERFPGVLVQGGGWPK